MIALLMTGASSGAVLLGPMGAASATPGTCINLTPTSGNAVSGTACYTQTGSSLTITITLTDGGTPTHIYICYAESNQDANFSSPGDCAGQTAGYFDGQATPQGGTTLSGNPATVTLTVNSNTSPAPTAGTMTVDTGDFVYVHVTDSGGTNGNTAATFGHGYNVQSPNPMVPDARFVVLFPVLGAGVVGGGFWYRHRRTVRRRAAA